MNRKFLITLALALTIPTAAHAFVDERSKPELDESEAAWAQMSLGKAKPPAPAAASKLATIDAGQTSAANTEPTPISLPAAIALSPTAAAYGAYGDFSRPMWQTKYPGPYGKMNLSDALIAQIVPVAGAAIELGGAADLLDRKVVIGKGMNRKETLQNMAEQAQVSVKVEGTLVTISTEPAPTQAAPALATLDPAAQKKPRTNLADVSIPVPVAPAKESKTWKIDPGTMLSVAVLSWADQWGWKVVWQASIDYRIEAPIAITGDFLDGISEIIDAYRTSNRPLWGDWNDAQRVLVIREPNSRDSR